MIQPTVDVAVLSRDLAPLDARVERAIRTQAGANIRLHRVVGAPRDSDRNRFTTIARARNGAKLKACSEWFMFVDDDVVIPRDCIRRLVAEFTRAPAMGAIGVPYLSNCSSDDSLCDHITMGATLFRRAAIGSIRFRESPGRCDCQCCCDDLRQQGWGTAYLPGLHAVHLDLSETRARSFTCQQVQSPTNHSADSRFILTAFDHWHCQKFQDRFLSSLRSSGNDEEVIAVAYGLSASEARALARQQRLTVIQPPYQRRHVVAERFFHFRDVVGGLPRDSVVAYWDAGDIIFQRRLTELWREVRSTPTKVLVVAEPWTTVTVRVRDAWIRSITSDYHRAQLLRLVRYKPNINGGFAAAALRPFEAFTEAVCRLIESPGLQGARGIDQIAMNAHCYHSNCHRFIDDGWNYCLSGRLLDETIIAQGSPILRKRDRKAVPVVHGTGGTLDDVPTPSLPIQPEFA